MGKEAKKESKEVKKDVKPKEKEEVKKEHPKAKERFSSNNDSVVQDLLRKGFHVEEQIVVNGRLLYIFKESKEEIEGGLNV